MPYFEKNVWEEAGGEQATASFVVGDDTVMDTGYKGIIVIILFSPTQ